MAQLSMVEWLRFRACWSRFPTLKIAYSESQIGWMPFILERLDKVFTHTGLRRLSIRSSPEPPSTYVPGRVYGCFFDDETGIATATRSASASWSSRSTIPHQDTTWPNTHLVVERIAEQVTPEELELILRTNAMEMLGLN